MHSSADTVSGKRAAEVEDETIDGALREPVESPRAVEPAAPLDDYPELVQVERRHYAISGEIAQGGVGRVLEARDLRLGRAVAIKELLPRNRHAARRFEREARITARLQHPSIIHVYEAGVWPGGEPFYAMTRVSGRSLAEVVAERPSLEDRLGLLPNVIAVADALAYAHSQDVIHRDLKPANVLVGAFGETVVIDWGLAKDLAGPGDPAMSLELRPRPAEETLSGSIVGTPAYMPPEQARGEPLDHRADVYALGALLYKVLVGRAPYTAPTSQEVLRQVLDGPPRSVEDCEPGTPGDLVAIVKKAMHRDLALRYPTAAELAADLKRFETGQLVAAHHYTRRQLVWRWLRRHRVAVGIGALALALFAVFGTLSVQKIIEEKERAETEQRKDQRRRAALLEERGRVELLAGRAGRALANLAGAVLETPGGALSFLIAEAMRPFEAEIAVVRAGAGAVIVAYSPDGTAFATASADGRVALWDAAGRPVRELDRGQAGVAALAWSPDGSQLATAGDDGIVRLWTAQGASVRELGSHDGRIDQLEFSRDGTRLLSAGADRRALVWDLEDSGRRELVGHDSAVTSARFSPDGTRVVTGAESGKVAVFVVKGGALDWPLRAHSGVIRTVRWSPAGDRVLTASADGTARVWDPTKGKPVAAPIQHSQDAEIDDAEWSSDGRLVVTAGSDHLARVWVVPDPPLVGEIPAAPRQVAELAHADRVVLARFSSDDRWIVTAGDDHAARLWDAGGHLLATFEHPDALSSIELSPDGTTLVTGCRDGTARVWDLTRSIAPQRELSSPIHALAVSATGVIAAGTDDSRVTLWRLDGRERQLRHHDGRVFAVGFSPDGAQLASAGEDDAVAVWAVDVDVPLRTLAVGEASILAVAYSADGRALAAADEEGVLRIWAGAAGAPVTVTPPLGDEIVALAWSPRGDVLAGATAGGVYVWSARGELLTRFPGVVARALAFDARGERLVVGSVRDAVILGYASGTLTAMLTLEGPTGEVAAVAIDRERSLVFTGGVDGVARVWDAEKGVLLATRTNQGEAIESLALSPGDERLWIGTTEGNARAWDVPRLHDPALLAEFLARRVPWRLGDDDVVRRVVR